MAFPRVLLCVSLVAPSTAVRHIDQTISEQGSLSSDITLLTAGASNYILNMLNDGIPSEGGDVLQKLGPGLYTTVYRDASLNHGVRGGWTDDAEHPESGEHTWRSHVWKSTSRPFTLVMKLRGSGLRFATLPHPLWYGYRSSWATPDDSMKHCLESFDGVLIPTVVDSAVGNPNDETCKRLRAHIDASYDDESISTCELVSNSDLEVLVDAGCINELKMNPGKEGALRLVALAEHGPGADPFDFLPLDKVRMPSADISDVDAVKRWLCPRVVKQSFKILQEPELEPLFLRDMSLDDACEEIVSSWNAGQWHGFHWFSYGKWGAHGDLDLAVSRLLLKQKEANPGWYATYQNSKSSRAQKLRLHVELLDHFSRQAQTNTCGRIAASTSDDSWKQVCPEDYVIPELRPACNDLDESPERRICRWLPMI